MLNDSFLFLDSERGEIVFSREATSIYGTGTNCRMEDVSAWGPYCRNRCTSILRHLRCPPGQQQPQCSRIRLGSDQRSWRLHQSQLHQYGIYAKEARRRKRCSLPHPGWNLLPWWRRRHSKTTARRRLSDQSVQGTPNLNGNVTAKSIKHSHFNCSWKERIESTNKTEKKFTNAQWPSRKSINPLVNAQF